MIVGTLAWNARQVEGEIGVRLMRFVIWPVLLLAGCVQPSGPPLISAMSPPGQGSKSEPQPIGSLPPGAAGIGAGPNATHPDIASITVGKRR